MYANNLSRDSNIDFLRFIGLTAIILVHVTPPLLISQLRAFDVSLMVFVSGLAASNKIINDYKSYFWKRTKRLVIPVWIFLALYIPFLEVISNLGLLSVKSFLSADVIIDSFALRLGIGYIWIFRIFLMMMFLLPVIQWSNKKIISNRMYLLLIAVALCIQYVLIFIFNSIEDGFLRRSFHYYIIDCFGYALLLSLGVRIRNINNTEKRWWVVISLLTLIGGIIIYVNYNGFPIILSPTYKYPPYGYYLIYGMVCCILLWCCKSMYERFSKFKFFSYIGSNTCWIYLWHIPVLLLSSVLFNSWWYRFLFVYSISILFYTIQRRIVVLYLNNTSIQQYLL